MQVTGGGIKLAYNRTQFQFADAINFNLLIYGK